MMTEAAIDGGIMRTCTPRSVKSWKTARGLCVFTQTVCSLDLGGRADDGVGRTVCLFDPRYRKRVNPQKTAPELYEAQSIVNSVDYLPGDCRGLLWQLARNAEGDDPTNLESGSLASQCRSFASNHWTIRGSLSGGCADSGQTSAA